jgi:hypothetical protein
MSFETMKKPELYRTAVEDFAVDVKAGDSEKVIRAALLEAGVTWDMYLEAHPELKPVEDTNVVKAVDTKPKRVRYAEPEVPNAEDLYLVKMNRDNPYFQFRQYVFTKDHPFVPMDADSTNAILTEEDGFSIARPAEAAEYYS